MDMILGKKKLVLIALSLMTTACSRPGTNASQVQNSLKQSISIESKLPDIIQQINNKEKTEQELFKQMAADRAKSEKNSQQLTKQAVSSAESRKKELSKADEIIKNAESKLKNVKQTAMNIGRQQIKKNVNKLIEDDLKRFKEFHKWSSEYETSIVEDEKLYKMMSDPNVKSGQLEGQLEKVDNLYQKASTYEIKFNQETAAWNKAYKEIEKKI